MMKKILGFSKIADLQINTPGVSSDLGELSTWAETYSREKGEYWDASVSGYRFVSFSCREVSTDQEVALDSLESSQALRLTKACRDYSADHPIVTNPDDFRQAIQALYNAEIADFQIGDMINGAGVTLPSWISWTSKIGDLSSFKIWLSNDSFLTEYPEYHITVIRPVPDLRIFLGDYQLAVNEVDKKSVTDIVSEAQVAKELKPETVFTIFETDFVNKLNPDIKYTTRWGILIYGAAGDNIDSIKDAIIKDLLDGTGAPEEELEVIFPDLFRRTEFIVYPRWDLMSIPNMTTLSGLYSPMINLQSSIDFCVRHTNFYDEAWIKTNINAWPTNYKSVELCAINGQNNQVGMKDLKALYPDFINVSMSSPDFQRMTLKTQNWVQFVMSMTMEAETVTMISVLPQGMRRVNRSGKLYITGTHDKAAYLFAARSNPFYPK